MDELFCVMESRRIKKSRCAENELTVNVNLLLKLRTTIDSSQPSKGRRTRDCAFVSAMIYLSWSYRKLVTHMHSSSRQMNLIVTR